MQPGGVLRQSGVLPGMQQASLGLNNYNITQKGVELLVYSCLAVTQAVMQQVSPPSIPF